MVTCIGGHNPYFNRWFSAIRIWLIRTNIPVFVTILILIDGFLQYKITDTLEHCTEMVTILILIDGFLQYKNSINIVSNNNSVTIHILIDGFLQFKNSASVIPAIGGHNPYFNRWFSAILNMVYMNH